MRPECSAAEMETPDPECMTTLWSDWGPCSATCGTGVRIRARQLLVDGAAARACLAPGRKVLSEQQSCTVRADCGRVDVEAAIQACAEPLEVGPCRGSYERYAYDPTYDICGRFMYGGCRGNANNFLTAAECEQTCQRKQQQSKNGGRQDVVFVDEATTTASTDAAPVIDEIVNCQLTEWSGWSQCSVSCGMGIAERSRRILAEARNGGTKCPTTLVKRRRCFKGPCM